MESTEIDVVSDKPQDVITEIAEDNMNAGTNNDDVTIASYSGSFGEDLMGKVVGSEEEAFNLYNEYALRTGFSVRKGKYRYHQGTNKICQREYMCWKEGFKVTGDKVKKFNRSETRTGCKAHIRFSVKDGLWTVTRFHAEHNHELASPSERHLLKSGREITEDKAALIHTMLNAGISKKKAFSYLCEEAGGVEKVGFTMRDFYNYVNNKYYAANKKSALVDAADAQELMDYFRRRKAEDPMFFYAVQLDDENRITNFFWRDGRMKSDYDYFGDVVVFDTACCTNKYNAVCAPFIGVNNHWQNTIFGYAVLFDETTSFVWLFKSFLQSMGNVAPKTIITDQDQAVSNAIEEAFPNVHHRLCMSQIAKKAPFLLGSLHSKPAFRDLFEKCCRGCETETEFQSTWDQMLQKFDVEGHNWLNLLYKVRFKWSSAFARDTFFAGIASPERAESANGILEGVVDPSTSLINIINALDNVVSNLRSYELEEDFRCKQSTPPIAVRKSGILIHASKVYTHRIYNHFEEQFLNCLATTWVESSFNGSIATFQIMEEGCTKVSLVHLDSSNNLFCCSCKKFESDGILCCHVLRVLNVKCWTEIPNQYILKRWTKEAKKGITVYEESVSSHINSHETQLLWHNGLLRIACKLIDNGQLKASLRQICQKKLLEFEEEIEREVAGLRIIENSAPLEIEPPPIMVQHSVDKVSLPNIPHQHPRERAKQATPENCSPNEFHLSQITASNHSIIQFFPSMNMPANNIHPHSALSNGSNNSGIHIALDQFDKSALMHMH